MSITIAPINYKALQNQKNIQNKTISQKHAPSFKSQISDDFTSSNPFWELKNEFRGWSAKIVKADFPKIFNVPRTVFENDIEFSVKQLMNDYIAPIISESKYDMKNLEMPNCIMVEDPSGTVSDELVDLVKVLSEKYVHQKYLPATPTIPDAQRSLYHALKESEEMYQKTGKRTLIYLEDFEKLVLKETEFHVTEWMKAITTACADDYHATIIFKTKDSSKFIEEINVPHRVGVNMFAKLPYRPDVPSEIVSTTKETIKETGKKIEQAVNEVKEQISESVKNTAETVKENTENAVKNTSEKIKEQVENAAKNTGKKNPLKKTKNKFLLVLGAILTGLVVCKDKIVEYWNKLMPQNKNTKS